MTIEKATYSYSKVYQACKLVKTLNIDCKRKAEHFSIASQIKETTEKCYNLTGVYSLIINGTIQHKTISKRHTITITILNQHLTAWQKSLYGIYKMS